MCLDRHSKYKEIFILKVWTQRFFLCNIFKREPALTLTASKRKCSGSVGSGLTTFRRGFGYHESLGRLHGTISAEIADRPCLPCATPSWWFFAAVSFAADAMRRALRRVLQSAVPLVWLK
jgi:hypothetical protein